MFFPLSTYGITLDETFKDNASEQAKVDVTEQCLFASLTKFQIFVVATFSRLLVHLSLYSGLAGCGATQPSGWHCQKLLL
jgi:hypothetical protein